MLVVYHTFHISYSYLTLPTYEASQFLYVLVGHLTQSSFDTCSCGLHNLMKARFITIAFFVRLYTTCQPQAMIHLPSPTKLAGNTFCFKMLLYFIDVGKLHSVPNLLVQKRRDDFERNPKPEWRRDNENLLQPCWICILRKQDNASCLQKGRKRTRWLHSSLLATCGLITKDADQCGWVKDILTAPQAATIWPLFHSLVVGVKPLKYGRDQLQQL